MAATYNAKSNACRACEHSKPCAEAAREVFDKIGTLLDVTVALKRLHGSAPKNRRKKSP